jgi:hypothetical protein
MVRLEPFKQQQHIVCSGTDQLAQQRLQLASSSSVSSGSLGGIHIAAAAPQFFFPTHPYGSALCMNRPQRSR